MENRETYNGKTPFYMTYPMQNLYMAELEYEKDMERMKELYPREVRQIQEMVERRCDEMEYEGSRMYDENPDKYMLERESKLIAQHFGGRNDSWLGHLIEIMFHNEIYRRRCRNRRCSRWW